MVNTYAPTTEQGWSGEHICTNYWIGDNLVKWLGEMALIFEKLNFTKMYREELQSSSVNINDNKSTEKDNLVIISLLKCVNSVSMKIK